MQDLFQDNGQIVETPFTSVLLHVLETVIVVTKTNMIEKHFITQLINTGTKELGKLTASQIAEQETTPLQLDMKSIKSHMEQMKELPITVKQSLMNIFPAPSTVHSETAIEDLLRGYMQDDTPLKNVIQPEFYTVAPPLCPVEDELVWFDLTNPAWHKPIYDISFGSVSAATVNNKRGKSTESTKNSGTSSDSAIDCSTFKESVQDAETGKNHFSFYIWKRE